MRLTRYRLRHGSPLNFWYDTSSYDDDFLETSKVEDKKNMIVIDPPVNDLEKIKMTLQLLMFQAMDHVYLQLSLNRCRLIIV